MNYCHKIPYPTKDAALKSMVQLNSKHEKQLKAAYKCTCCGKWHLTSNSKHRSKKTQKWLNKINLYKTNTINNGE